MKRAILIISLVYSTIVTCASDDLLDYSGTMIITGDQLTLYDLSTGSYNKFNAQRFSCPKSIMTIIPGDTAIIMSACTDGPVEIPWKETAHAVYQVNPKNGNGRLVERVNDSSYYCTFIDYSPVLDRYLYSGKYAGNEGLFILDREFELDKDVSFLLNSGRNEFSAEAKNAVTFVERRAFFFSENRIIFSPKEGNIVIGNYLDSSIELVDAESGILDISHDRNSILLGNSNDKSKSLILMNLDTMSKDTIRVSKGLQENYCFSPNDSAVAYVEIVDTWGTDVLFIWDRKLKKRHKLDFNVDNTFNRGILWLNRDLVKSDSLNLH